MSVHPGTFPVVVSRVGGDTPATIGATATATRVVRYANRAAPRSGGAGTPLNLRRVVADPTATIDDAAHGDVLVVWDANRPPYWDNETTYPAGARVRDDWEAHPRRALVAAGTSGAVEPDWYEVYASWPAPYDGEVRWAPIFPVDEWESDWWPGSSPLVVDGSVWWQVLAEGNGRTGNVEPDWASAPAIGDTLSDGDVTWMRVSDAAATWQADTDYRVRAVASSELVGDVVVVEMTGWWGDSLAFTVTGSSRPEGQSGGTEPPWLHPNDTYQETGTLDGDLVWLCRYGWTLSPSPVRAPWLVLDGEPDAGAQVLVVSLDRDIRVYQPSEDYGTELGYDGDPGILVQEGRAVLLVAADESDGTDDEAEVRWRPASSSWPFTDDDGSAITSVDIVLDDQRVIIRSTGDLNHVLGYAGDWNVDGPMLSGYEGIAFVVGDGNDPGGDDAQRLIVTIDADGMSVRSTVDDTMQRVVLDDDPRLTGTPADGPALEILINGLEHRSGFASADPITIEVDADVDPIFAGGSSPGDWDDLQIQEIGGPAWDPASRLWALPFSGREPTYAHSRVGMVLSADPDAASGTWFEHPDNPLTGALLGEDPILVRNPDGTLYRDSLGRALMFMEEKRGPDHVEDPADNEPGAYHDGVLLYRSNPYLGDGSDLLTLEQRIETLSGWTLTGRSLEVGDSTDRTSPTAIATQRLVVDELVDAIALLVEERTLPDQQGHVVLAWSYDEGVTFTVENPEPVIPRGPAGSWYELSVVPDDIMLVDTVWIVLAHGQDADGWYSCGRFATLDDPADWGPGSFVDLRDNPVTDAYDTVMCFGRQFDHTRAVAIAEGEIREHIVRSPYIFDEVDRAAQDARDDAQDARIGAAESAITGQGSAITGLSGVLAGQADTIAAHDGSIAALAGRADRTDTALITAGPNILERALSHHEIDWVAEADIDRSGQSPSDNTGFDLSNLGVPDALDPSSDLTPPAISLVAPGTYTGNVSGVVWNRPPIPDGKRLIGARLTTVAWANLGVGANVLVQMTDGAFQPIAGGGYSFLRSDGRCITYRFQSSATIEGGAGDDASGAYTQIIVSIPPTTDAAGVLFIGLAGPSGAAGYQLTAADIEWAFVDDTDTSTTTLATDTLWEAKGDLVVATGAAAATRLAVSSQPGETIVPDVNASQGLAWGSPVDARDVMLRPPGAIAETFDRLRTISNQTPLTSGRLLLVAIPLPRAQAITSITWTSGSQAAVTPTNQWFGLFDKDLHALALTVDDGSAAWLSSAGKTLALTAPYTTTYAGKHFLGIMVAAATPPSLRSVVNSAGITFLDLVGQSTSSLTSRPSLPFTAASLAAASSTPWGYVS